MGLAAAILIIFIIFVAFFINYGKTFRIKNQVINKLEQSEGLIKQDIIDYVNDLKYTGKKISVCYNKVERPLGTTIGFTYKVTLYMHFDRSILGSSFNLYIPIQGETKTIDSGSLFNEIKVLGFDRALSGIESCYSCESNPSICEIAV